MLSKLCLTREGSHRQMHCICSVVQRCAEGCAAARGLLSGRLMSHYDGLGSLYPPAPGLALNSSSSSFCRPSFSTVLLLLFFLCFIMFPLWTFCLRMHFIFYLNITSSPVKSKLLQTLTLQFPLIKKANLTMTMSLSSGICNVWIVILIRTYEMNYFTK